MFDGESRRVWRDENVDHQLKECFDLRHDVVTMQEPGNPMSLLSP